MMFDHKKINIFLALEGPWVINFFCHYLPIYIYILHLRHGPAIRIPHLHSPHAKLRFVSKIFGEKQINNHAEEEIAVRYLSSTFSAHVFMLFVRLTVIILIYRYECARACVCLYVSRSGLMDIVLRAHAILLMIECIYRERGCGAKLACSVVIMELSWSKCWVEMLYSIGYANSLSFIYSNVLWTNGTMFRRRQSFWHSP